MESRKNIVSKVNLVLFLCSFSLCSVNSFSALSAACSDSHFNKQVSEKQSTLIDDSSRQTSEKNESEMEDYFELDALVFPLFFTYFHFEISRFSYIYAKPAVKELSSSIYICSFRV